MFHFLLLHCDYLCLISLKSGCFVSEQIKYINQAVVQCLFVLLLCMAYWFLAQSHSISFSSQGNFRVKL